MDGIIVINKPKGCTSHDIVFRVKKLTGEKVGHTGTLDPNATGVLPILIGKGTLLSKYLINHDKTYEVILKLGKKTDTADSEGDVIEEQIVDKTILDYKNITDVLKTFIGKQHQMPPMYSAIKVNGKKLYEYARKGEHIKVQPREIEIYSIKVLNIDIKDYEVCFEVSCSKGTYIRSLCEDIAEKFGTVGFMKELKRTKVGDFDLNDAITVEEFEEYINNLEQYNIKKEFLDKKIILIEDVFKKKPCIVLNKNRLKKFYNGVKLQINKSNEIYRVYDEDNDFIGTGIINNGELKRDIIIKNIENV